MPRCMKGVIRSVSGPFGLIVLPCIFDNFLLLQRLCAHYCLSLGNHLSAARTRRPMPRAIPGDINAATTSSKLPQEQLQLQPEQIHRTFPSIWRPKTNPATSHTTNQVTKTARAGYGLVVAPHRGYGARYSNFGSSPQCVREILSPASFTCSSLKLIKSLHESEPVRLDRPRIIPAAQIHGYRQDAIDTRRKACAVDSTIQCDQPACSGHPQ